MPGLPDSRVASAPAPAVKPVRGRGIEPWIPLAREHLTLDRRRGGASRSVAAAPEVLRPRAPSDRARGAPPDVLHGPLIIRPIACSTTTTHASARSLQVAGG
jgi:hypothetical protein